MVALLTRHCGLGPQSQPCEQIDAFIHMVEIADQVRNDNFVETAARVSPPYGMKNK
jgi:hypothetical protein